MAPKPFDLGRQSNPGRYPIEGVARLVNCYAVNMGEGGAITMPIHTVAGLADFGTLPSTSGGVRAMIEVDGLLYAVCGRTVYSVTPGGVIASIGGIATDGFVTMARNGRETGAQLGIVSDGLYYMLDAGTFAQVTDPDLPPPNSIFYLNGYFFFTHSDGRFTWSEIEDGDAIDGLAFDTATANPDGLVIGKPRGRDGVFFGARSTEIRTISDGSGDLPLIARSALAYGAYGPGGVVALENTVIWPSTNEHGAFAGVRLLEGDVSKEVGTEAINRLMAASSSDDIVGTSWTENGRTHVAWSGTDWTWVLDLKTGLWHERSSDQGRWRVAHVAQLGDSLIAGDASSPTLYTMSSGTNDEAGNELVVTLQTPPLVAFPGRIEANEIRLFCLTGMGAATGATQNVNPTIGMQFSNDGETWSTERRRSLGTLGHPLGRGVMWTALGTQPATGRSYRFHTSAAVSRGFLSASWDGKVCKP